MQGHDSRDATVYTSTLANNFLLPTVLSGRLQPNMRNLLLTVCFSFFSLASTFADDRPNTVLIMVDDMGFSDI